MDGGTIFGIIVLIAIGNMIYKAYKAHEARQREENFKHSNPKEYAQLMQMEHERQMMAHDEKRLRHQNMQTGAGILAGVFRIFRK